MICRISSIRNKIFLFVLLLIFFNLSNVNAAHFIVGQVLPANDSTSADNKIITLWNPSQGISDNLTDIIGPNGNSGTNNFYLIDCELLTNSCVVGDILSLQIINLDEGYNTGIVNVTITGAGFDVVADIQLNSPPSIYQVQIDDDIFSPTKEIDLTAGSDRIVNCTAVGQDLDGESSLTAVLSRLFHNSSSLDAADDNNDHYTNTSCLKTNSYGNENQTLITCGFSLKYYSNPGPWNCSIRLNDTLNAYSNGSNDTLVNTLIALEVESPLDYGPVITVPAVTSEKQLNISNRGNIKINLSLSGYGGAINDNWAMSCMNGSENISILYQKYNLTASNPGELTLGQFESLYKNLTSNVSINRFNLDFRKNDISDEAFNSTYWRIYVPGNITASCSGNIVIGASILSE